MSDEEFSIERREAIDAMSVGAMHNRWVNAPIGAFRNGDEYTEYFKKIMLEKREADPAGWTQASKDNRP